MQAMGMRPLQNPPNPWASTHVEYLEAPPLARLEVMEQDAGSILSENRSPDIPFRFSVNCYRGCHHGCAYCYARPSHQWLGLGAGTDFERRIVVKRNAPQQLEAAFIRRTWQGDAITFSGNTDCYQPLEAHYGLTRGCLEVCVRYRNPANIITKGVLIRRDLDVLSALEGCARVGVFMSIPTLDDALGRVLEPYAPAPSKRLETLGLLAAAGLRVGVAVAPVVPGLTDAHIPQVLTAARNAGAAAAFMIMLRLPAEVKDIFYARVSEHLSPAAVQRIRSNVQDVRGGKNNDPRFGSRMRGQGPRADAVHALFAQSCQRLGLNLRQMEPAGPSTFARSERSAQLSLLPLL